MSINVHMIRGSSHSYRTGEVLRSATQEFIGYTSKGKKLSDVALEKLEESVEDGLRVAWESVRDTAPEDEGLLKNCIAYTMDGETFQGLNSLMGHQCDESAYEAYCSLAGDIYRNRKNSVAGYVTAFAMRSICVSGDQSKSRHDPEKWYNNVNYAVFVEYGTFRTPAQHFMRRGMEAARGAMLAEVVQGMKWVRA